MSCPCGGDRVGGGGCSCDPPFVTRTLMPCIACGGELLEVRGSSAGMVSTSLEHVGPGDAACRLVLETLADDLRARDRLMLEAFERSMQGWL